ncbi:MAG: hypothetical protein FJY36_06250 [Betaproteobacteria bacterium]|nr:hypothetical protein [Betaproteobacteria bacterium]
MKRPTTVWRAFGAVAAAVALAVLQACVATAHPRLEAAALTPAQRCEAEGSTWDASSERLGGYCAKGSAAQCQALGGRWQRVCMLGTLACVKPYADAGKACQSGHECQGRRCLMNTGASRQWGAQTGHCIANDNPCHFGINLENGLPVPTAVAD